MAISGWRVWNAEDSAGALARFTPVGHATGLQRRVDKAVLRQAQPVSALLDVVALESMIVRYIATARKVDTGAALCFVPYAAWVGFATVLNADIARRNPDAWKKFPRPKAA